MACLLQKLAARINQLHVSGWIHQLEIAKALDEMAVGRFRGPSGLAGPLSSDPPQGGRGPLGLLWPDSGWIYRTNIPPADLHIHHSSPSNPLCLPEAPAAKRQFVSDVQSPPSGSPREKTKASKVECLGSKQASADDNKDVQRSRARLKKPALNTHLEKTTIHTCMEQGSRNDKWELAEACRQ